MTIHPLDLEAASRKYAEVNGFDYERHKKHLNHRMRAALEAYEFTKKLRNTPAAEIVEPPVNIET